MIIYDMRSSSIRMARMPQTGENLMGHRPEVAYNQALSMFGYIH